MAALLAGFAACVQIPDTALDIGVDSPQTAAGSGLDTSPCQIPCQPGYWCHEGRCLVEQGKCTDDDTCINDTACQGGACLPRAVGAADPTCAVGVKPFAASELKGPAWRCSWTGGNVVMTPLVGDLDGDGRPEIVFTNAESGALVAIRGGDCAKVFSTSSGLGTRSQLALADLTGDKIPEIVGVGTSSRVQVYDAAGQLLAIAPEAAKTGPTKYSDGGPAIADLDGKAPPEIVYAGMALRYAAGKLQVLYNNAVEIGHWGVLSAVADVDLDGKPEVLTGTRIFDGLTGKDETPAPVKTWPGGYVAVAQLDDSTKTPEVVLVSSQGTAQAVLRVYDPLTGKVVFGPYAFDTFFGGPPTVADFDGDGEPEIGVAGYSAYHLFDPGDCSGVHPPPACAAPGRRWTRPIKDISSGSTGSSVFDFNGDGRAEVVYRDECWLRIYDGETGTTRAAAAFFSTTILDMPVVADLQGDGHADLIVPSTVGTPDYCAAEPDLGLPHVAPARGVHVLEDPHNRWLSSRAVWNQHTYHVTNIRDDLTVPPVEPPSWKADNSYRRNVQGKGQDKVIPGPDLTAAPVAEIELSIECAKRWRLRVKLCNRGAARAVAGVEGTFFRGDPRAGGSPICSAKTKKELGPGSCVQLSCSWDNPPAGSVDLWFAADRSATVGAGWLPECREGNNLLHLPGASCPTVQ